MILPDLITQHAQKSPKKIAFIYREKKISFGELEDQILRCAQGLARSGVKKRTTFGLLLRNCPEFVIISMALSKLGAIAVPINFLEKPDRIAMILNDAKAKGILTAREFSASALKAAQKIKSLRQIILKDDVPGHGNKFNKRKVNWVPFSQLLGEDRWSAKSPTREEDVMMLLYTSGTTGAPKGVMLTQKNFISNLHQCLNRIKLRPQDRFLCLLPMFHSFAWTTCILIPLSLGAQTVIIESLLPFDPVIKAIWKYKITLFVAVPQIYSALANKIRGAKAFVLRWLNPVRVCISGAAPLPQAIHKKFEKTLGIPLLEGYGLTETSPVVTLNPLRKRKIGTVGLPLPGVDVEIRDDRGGRVPAGEVGEIWIRGENVMAGYYKRKRETQDVLTKEGWLKSGDLGRKDKEGYVTIVDRKKDLIIVKGLNVYPQEVENVIAQHPNIREVAVIGKMDSETSEELIRAFVTLKEGAKLDLSEVFSLCREQLAAYKRPKNIVVLDEMPKNALQKILKKDLRAR